MIEEFAGDAGVFAREHIDLLEYANCSETHVLEIANWCRDEVQRSQDILLFQVCCR